MIDTHTSTPMEESLLQPKRINFMRTKTFKDTEASLNDNKNIQNFHKLRRFNQIT